MSFLEQDRPIVRNIISASGQVVIPVNGLASLSLVLTLAGVTGGNFTFEGSLDTTDGTDGNWYSVQGIRTNGAAIENTTGALSASPGYGHIFDVTAFNWFRIRATAGTFGTATVTAAPSASVRPLYGAQQGVAPRDSALPGNPLFIASGLSANRLGVTSGRNVDLFADVAGKLITKDFAPAELDWRYTAAADAAPFSATTATQLVAAVATYRNYITGLQLINVGATATEFVIQDNVPNVMWRTFLPANMTLPVTFNFISPLRTGGSGTNSRIDARCVTAGASIHISMQGYAAI